MTARSLSPWMGTLSVVYTLVWILSYYHGVAAFPANLTSETGYLAYVNKQRIVGAEVERIQTDRESVCFSWCLETTSCQGINISYDSKSKGPINCQFFSNGTRFEQDENSVAYLRQPVGGNDFDKQKLADAIAEFLNNNSCKQSNTDIVARELSGSNQEYLSTQYRNIYDSWYYTNKIPLDNKDQAELFNIFFLTVQQAPIYHVLEYTKNAYLRTGTDPNTTFESIVCNDISVRQGESDVRFQTTDMVQVGRGDRQRLYTCSFILTFEHWRCNGNNRYTSATVRNAPECQLWNLDRLLVDGGGSGSAVKNILSVIGNSSITVEGVPQKGHISHLIVTHLDEDHLGGIGTLLESYSHIFIQDTKVIIDDIFTTNTRAAVGAPISSACANIHQAVNSHQTSTSFARANRVTGMTTEVMLKIHWQLYHTPSKYQVAGSLNHPDWSGPSGLDISFLGPSSIVFGRALRSPDMCGNRMTLIDHILDEDNKLLPR
ncbi:hypothetical protein K7432_011765 [Basidiobolus ranarum]|uniref:Metallo-beta-lactamase domain-containing protein n=1 Tax=Basidiobolus ranarum TaxID=34480 RepID=A0ABR2WLU3_9FUNG